MANEVTIDRQDVIMLTRILGAISACLLDNSQPGAAQEIQAVQSFMLSWVAPFHSRLAEEGK